MTTLSQYAMENHDKVTCMNNGARIFTLRGIMAMMLPHASVNELLFYINVLKSVEAKEDSRFGIKSLKHGLSVQNMENDILTRKRICTVAYENGDFIVSSGEDNVKPL